MLKIALQLGCVFQDMEPPKSSSILRKSSNILKPIRCVRFTEAVVRHANIRDQNPSLGMICPSDPHQRNTNAPKFEDRSQEETEWQERCAREAAWKLAKISENEWRKIKQYSSHLRTIVCCRLQSVDAHDQQKGFEFRWIGNRDDIEKSDDGYNSQWWSADAWRGHSSCQRIGYSWQWKSSSIRHQFYRWESFAMKTNILMNGSMVKNHISLKNGIRIQCNTENFAPIVVLGLSTSSSSSFHSSTSMTPSRQEIDHHTSSTVSSESVARQERRDPCGIDHYPAAG